MPLTFDDLSTWLSVLAQGAGVSLPANINEGPYVPDMPNKLITITQMSGTGFQNEGALDGPSFQLRVRSAQNDQTSAETLANALDKLIFDQLFPQRLKSGTPLLLVSRIGGAPAIMGPPDDAFRYDYVCNYYAMVGVSR